MAATPKREKISAVDTAWLRMDRPQNLMMICGVLLFRDRVSLARLRNVIGERFLSFRRFRQRAVEMPGMAFWETDRHFDIERHVVHTALPGNAGRKELQDLVSRLSTTPLDPARPMWQFHLVDNYAGGSAVVVRIHHSYADGIALVRVMLSMTDAAPNGPPAMPFEPRPRRRAEPEDALGQLLAPFSGAMDTARKIGATILEKGVGLWSDPSKAVALAGQGTALTAEIAKLVLMPQDSHTRFKGAPGIGKRVAWADPLPLADVKTIGKALGASVNDILLSSVAGAIRAYLVDKGDAVDGVMIRALVPVSVGCPDMATTWPGASTRSLRVTRSGPGWVWYTLNACSNPVAPGNVISLRDGKVVVDTDVGEFEMPMERIAGIEFGGTPAPIRTAGRIRLRDGAVLNVDQFRFEADGIAGKSPVLGELKFAAADIAELVLAPQPARFPSGPAPKKVDETPVVTDGAAPKFEIVPAPQ